MDLEDKEKSLNEKLLLYIPGDIPEKEAKNLEFRIPFSAFGHPKHKYL